MKKKFKYLLIIIPSVLIILILAAWGFGTWYFHMHKKEVMAKSAKELSEKIGARVFIKDADIHWLRNFPYASVELSDLSILDTFYNSDSGTKPNEEPFLKAQGLYVSCNPFKLISGNFHIEKAELSNGFVNYQRNKMGHSNLHMLDNAFQKQKDDKKRPKNSLFNALELRNIKIYMADDSEQHKTEIIIKYLSCKTEEINGETCYHVNMKTHINYLGFNTLQGFYGNNKELEGSFPLYMNEKKKILYLRDVKMHLGKDLVIANGNFHLDPSQLFTLHLSMPSANYRNVETAMMALSRHVLDTFNLAHPLKIEADLSGDTKYLSIPRVKVELSVKDNTAYTPFGPIYHCSFKGIFINDAVPGKPFTDENSRFTLSDFDGVWNHHSHLHAAKAEVTNLITPYLETDFRIKMEVSDLDSLLQSNSFSLEDGIADIQLQYKGPASFDLAKIPDIKGSVVFKNAAFTYMPGNLSFDHFNATISFNHHDFTIDTASIRAGASSLGVKSQTCSFLPVYHNFKEPVVLNWAVYSSYIDLSDFSPLFTTRNSLKKKKIRRGGGSFSGITMFLDTIADKCDIQAAVFARKVKLNHFEADNFSTAFGVNDLSGWDISRLKFMHAGGEVAMNCLLQPVAGNSHKIVMNASAKNVNISKLFYAFDNFGIDGLSYANLDGNLTLQTQIRFVMDPRAKIKKGSINCRGHFILRGGELIDFKPIETIGDKVMPGKDLKRIKFDDLKDRFSVSDNILRLDKMEISSTVLHFYVSGRYGLDGEGTDLMVQIPLNNLNKNEQGTEPENKGLMAKNGISIYVQAVNDDDGKILLKYKHLGNKQE